MNATDNSDFSDFLHSQYEQVKESVDKDITDSSERYGPRELIGEGAQKKVFKVYDHSCSRYVAVAVLKDDSPQERAQFLREGRLTALLEHPNIMPVYEIGRTEEGQPFFTMKLIEGDTLQKIIDRLKSGDEKYIERYPRSVLLDIFIKLCEALAYAHSKGVIHRDLKPENIHVGAFGEVLLSDWGLASLLFDQCDEQILNDLILQEIDLKVSLKGQIKGTPGYIAPEILNERNAYSTKSDVYALGAILHAVLTLNVTVSGKTVEEMLSAAKSGNLSLFQNSDKAVPESLKAVCTKALKPAPNDRYSTVNCIIDDVRNFQNGFATDAEEAGFRTQLALFYKRHKKVCNLTLLFVIVLFITTVLFLNSLREKDKETNRILSNLVETYKEKEKLEQELIPVYSEKAYNAFINLELDSALALIEVAFNISPENKKTRKLYAKMLMARQEFDRAALLLDGIDQNLFKISTKYAAVKNEKRLDHEHLISFLKDIGPSVEDDIAYIYKNILIEEFKIETDLNKKIELMKAELKYRNPKLKSVNISIEVKDDSYFIDLSNNPHLQTVFILEKFGPVSVQKLNLSDTSVIRLHPLRFMKIEEMHVRNTGVMKMEEFNNYYNYLDAQGSKTDFSLYLQGRPLNFLNIHNSAFSNYHVLTTLKKLKTLIVTRGRLPEDIRSRLPKDCRIIEK